MRLRSKLLNADNYLLQQHERVANFWQEKSGRPKKTLETICHIATIGNLLYTATAFAAQEEEFVATIAGALTIKECLRFAPPSFFKDWVHETEECELYPNDSVKQTGVVIYGVAALMTVAGAGMLLQDVFNEEYSRTLIHSGVCTTGLGVLFKSAKYYLGRVNTPYYNV